MNPETMTQPDHQSQLFGALRIAAERQLGSDAPCVDEDNHVRKLPMVRVNDVVLVDQPADDTAPHLIRMLVSERLKRPANWRSITMTTKS